MNLDAERERLRGRAAEYERQFNELYGDGGSTVAREVIAYARELESALIDAQASALAEMQERCAQVCDGLVMALDGGGKPYRRPADAEQCAAAIRRMK